MRLFRLTAAVSLTLMMLGCGGGEQAPSSRTSTARHTITGTITEFEQDDLSVRATDGRQLILWVGESPIPLEDLRAYFRQQTLLEFTYEARSSRLIPISITVASQTSPASPSP